MLKKILLPLICILFSIFLNDNANSQSKPYLLIVSFDGFRYDYLDKGITPNINKFADSGVKALSLRPCFPTFTFPNHFSIITGMYPENHVVIFNYFINTLTNEKFFATSKNQNSTSKWHLAETFWEYAQKNGVLPAAYFFPGSNLIDNPTFLCPEYQQSISFSNRISTICSWLRLEEAKRPHFLTLYFHEPDSISHATGVNSIETIEKIKFLDSTFALLLDSIASIGFKDSLNIILLSDHGLEDIDTAKYINISDILKDVSYSLQNYGTVAMIETDKNVVQRVYDLLKQKEDNYKVYFKKDIPAYWNFSKNPYINSILVVANKGALIIDSLSKKKMANQFLKAAHGYDNNLLEMNGIFIANGYLFKKNYKTNTLFNIDIFPLLCKIYGFEPKNIIDGKIERISFILNE